MSKHDQTQHENYIQLKRTGEAITRCSNKLWTILSLGDNALVEVHDSFFKPHADNKERRYAYKKKVHQSDQLNLLNKRYGCCAPIINPNTPIHAVRRWTIGRSNLSASPPPNLWRNETSVYAKKNMNENEIATAMNAGAVDGGADSIPLAELP